MKVISLKGKIPQYTCNAYLILGSWNRLQDVNALVDVGSDASIVEEIEKINTGIGKRPVEKIVLTHEHFDHAGGIKKIKSVYGAAVFAYKRFEGVDETLKDGDIIRMGDRDFEVIYAPVHSNDSICLYCNQEKVLFSGDTPLKVIISRDPYSTVVTKPLERFLRFDIRIIYSGHDSPVEVDTRGTDSVIGLKRSIDLWKDKRPL